MAKLQKLTKRIVSSAPLPPVRTPADRRKWTWLGDGAVPGFGVKLYGNGRRVFALRYRNAKGRQRLYKIGELGEGMTVEQARDDAEALRVGIRRGDDPQAEREAARVAPDIETVAQLATRWLTDYAESFRKRWKEDEYRVNRLIVPALGRLRLTDVTPARLSRWHRKIGEKSPVEANRAIETLRAAWRWAELQEILPPDAPRAVLFKGGKDAKVKRFREKSRDRWLRPEETERLLHAVAKYDDAHVRAAVQLLLLTGMRKRELLCAEWKQLDLERGEIRLPETKNGESQVRLLVPEAVTILRELPRVQESDYVFPSPRDPSKPRGDIKRPWESIREAAKLEGVTIHDLRRTCGSYMTQRGASIEIVMDVLGQNSPAAARIYARHSRENSVDALGTLAAVLAPIMARAGLSQAASEPHALPVQLRALLETAGNDPDALAAGLHALLAVDWGKAAQA